MVLQSLSNYHKHPVLHTTHGFVQGSTVEVLELENASILEQSPVRTGSIRDGDETVRVRIEALGPNPKVGLYLQEEYGIAFDTGPGGGELVVPLLQKIRLYVRDVVL